MEMESSSSSSSVFDADNEGLPPPGEVDMVFVSVGERVLTGHRLGAAALASLVTPPPWAPLQAHSFASSLMTAAMKVHEAMGAQRVVVRNDLDNVSSQLAVYASEAKAGEEDEGGRGEGGKKGGKRGGKKGGKKGGKGSRGGVKKNPAKRRRIPVKRRRMVMRRIVTHYKTENGEIDYSRWPQFARDLPIHPDAVPKQPVITAQATLIAKPRESISSLPPPAPHPSSAVAMDVAPSSSSSFFTASIDGQIPQAPQAPQAPAGPPYPPGKKISHVTVANFINNDTSSTTTAATTTSTTTSSSSSSVQPMDTTPAPPPPVPSPAIPPQLSRFQSRIQAASSIAARAKSGLESDTSGSAKSFANKMSWL